jgi:hypothetical protein
MKYFGIYKYFVQGFRLANRETLQLIRFNLLILAVIAFVSYIAALGAIKLTYSRGLQELIVIMASFPFVIYIAAGAMYYYISYSKGMSVRLNQLYRGYRWFSSYFWYGLFIMIMYMVFWKGLPDVFTMKEKSLPVITGTLCSFYVILRLFFLPLVFVDTKLTIEESIIESIRLSRNIQLQLLLFLLFAITILATGFTIFGAGILYAGSVILLAYIKFYLAVRDEYYSD